MSAQRTSSRAAAARRVLACLALAAFTALVLAGSASAAARWRLEVAANTSVAPGRQLDYQVVLLNDGDRAAPETTGGDATNCTPTPADPSKCYTVTARFPAGLTPTRVGTLSGVACTIDGGTNSVKCAVPGNAAAQQVGPRGSSSRSRVTTITVDVDGGASGTLTSAFDVTGAGGGTDTTVRPVLVSATPPAFGPAAFDGQVTADAAGTALTQAGGHAYAASTAMEFHAQTNPDPLIGFLWPVEPTKDIVVDLPPGLVGNPTVVDQCTLPELANMFDQFTPGPSCPPTSQVGVTLVRASSTTGSIAGPLPVFSLVPPPDVPARFGFNVAGAVVTIDAELRSEDDYGLTAVVRDLPQAIATQGTELILWGVPSDPVHKPDRACAGQKNPVDGGPTCESGAPRKAFWRNPTACTPDGVGLDTTLRIDSWFHPGDFKSASFESHLPPAYPAAPGDRGRAQGPDGCGRVPFDPELRATPSGETKAGSPSGFNFDLRVPQTDDPEGIGTSDLRKAVVTLPQGAHLSPSAAGGLAGCTSEQIALNSRGPPTCPDASKVGSLTIDTPLLREPLTGGVYLATPFDNPFDSLVAIYLVAEGPGLTVKLPGHVSPDPLKDGQLTATFDDQPQLPFSNLHLEFKGGPRAPIVLPKRCGTYTTHAVMTGWSGREVESDSSFTVDQDCGGGFTPGFEAGTQNPVAGGSSSFLLRMTRDDADEELSQVTVDMPAGLTGRIADAVLCDAAAGAAGLCGDGSRVGNVTVGAGAGTNPFYITNGRVHITEGYGGAPFGLSIVVPAVAGPFDLGTVTVRSQVFVDRHTAELRVVSEPLPTQLQGIPLDVRDVRVTIDRDGFILNPTSCEEKTVAGAIRSTAGSTANVSSRFQVGDCAALDLEPKLVVRVGGRRHTNRGRSTPLRTKLKMPAGGANLSKVRVTLPTVLNARLTVINDACTREQYDSGSDECEFARTGSAVARTPLLRDPLRGGVYFVRNGNPLPDLFVRLRGQVDFDLIGKITIPGSKRLRTTFDLVPDVPVSMFALRLVAGRDGSVGNAANLCSRRGKRARAALAFVGQNGKRLFERRRLHIGGCAKRSARARARRRGRR